MGMEVREYEEAFGGFGFRASALGEGYFFWLWSLGDGSGDGYDLFILLRSSRVISLPGGTADCCCCCRDDLLGPVELDMRGELAADDALDRFGLSPFTLLLAEPSREPE